MENSKRWNEHLTRQVFSQDIASSIQNASFVTQVQHDKLIWKAKKNGKYSVRSAYRLCTDELFDTSYLRRPRYWSGIWRLKVPSKVRNLFWSVCRGVLPTRFRLRDKSVQCHLSCVSCDADNEDVAHLLFEFPFAVQVWKMSGLWHEIQQVITSSQWRSQKS